MRLPVLLIPACVCTLATANTYHVATTGSNAGNGLSLATAWATLQYAADHIVPGDTVLVEDGIYAGFNLQDSQAGPADPTVIRCTGDGTQVTTPCSYNDLDGLNIENASWVEIRGFHVTGMPRSGIRTALSDHVTIAYNECADNGVWGIFTGFAEHCVIEHNSCSGSVDQHGIYFSNSADDPIIRFNHCFDNHDNGIHMNGDESQGGDGTISNAQVYGNIIHGNGTGGGSGINCDGVVNSVFYNNLLYDNHASGISLYRIDAALPSTGNRVFNNTIINAADSRWCLNITDGCTGNQVLNNILINQHPWHGSITCDVSALDGFVSDYNLVVNSFSTDGGTAQTLTEWQGLGHDMHSAIAGALSALFVAPAGADYHPLDGGAQQVEFGTNAVQATVADDLDGTPRPQGSAFDVGCYEFDGATSTAGSARPVAALVDLGDRVQLMRACAGCSALVFDEGGRARGDARMESDRGTIQWNGTGVFLVKLQDGKGGPIAVLKCMR